MDNSMTSEERAAALKENCRMAYRSAEMSAQIMRDARRTGGWEGAERTARAFDRIAKDAKAAFDLCDSLLQASPTPPAPGWWRPSREEIATTAELIVRDVCELPDRTSPDDWPEAMLVTSEELYSLIVERFSEATPPAQTSEQAGEAVRKALERARDYITAQNPIAADEAILQALAALSRGEEAEWSFRDAKAVDWVASEMARELGGDALGWHTAASFAVDVARRAYGATHHPEAGAPSREAEPFAWAWESWNGARWVQNVSVDRPCMENMFGFPRRNLLALYPTPPALKASEEDPLPDRIAALAGNLLHVLPAGKVYLARDAADLAEEVRAILSERPVAGEDHSSRAVPLSTISEGWRPTHRHVKRGTTYRVFGVATVQCGPRWSPTNDHSTVTVYQGEDHKLWVRPSAEFYDGRFEPLPAPPAPTQDAEGEG